MCISTHRLVKENPSIDSFVVLSWQEFIARFPATLVITISLSERSNARAFGTAQEREKKPQNMFIRAKLCYFT